MRRTRNTRDRRGIVYLVPTPIGNMEDITLRAIRVLKESDIICCEDTRTTSALLSKLGIEKKKLVSLRSQNEIEMSSFLLDKVEKENLILSSCSDAGTPGISDPGSILCQKAIERGIPVSTLPGPSAVIAALSMSGIDTADFSFFGFPPTKKKARDEFFLDLKDRKETLVFYESPLRLSECLLSLSYAFGKSRKASVVREISKIYEETVHGTLEELSSLEDIKGECVIVVEGKKEDSVVDSSSIEDEIRELLSKGLSIKEIKDIIHERRGIKKSEVYDIYLGLKD